MRHTRYYKHFLLEKQGTHMEKILIPIEKWIQTVRLRQNLTTWELAKLIGISQASLSRIESGLAAVTVLTLRRLLRAMELPFKTLIDDGVLEYPHALPENFFSMLPPITAPTRDDYIAFAKLSSANRKELLAKFYAHHAQDVYGTSPASADAMDQAIPTPTAYIYDIAIDTLEHIAASDSIMILNDVGGFLYQIRKGLPYSLYNRYKNPKSANDALPLSYRSLRRLEDNFNKRVLFKDIINLDQALDVRGELVAFSWRAFGDYLDLLDIQPESSPPNEWLADVTKLTTICRLYQIAMPRVPRWVRDFRTLLSNYESDTSNTNTRI